MFHKARPIEKILCYLQRRDTTKDLILLKFFLSFKRIWKNIALKVEEDSSKTLVATIKQKLRLIGRQDVFSTFKKYSEIAMSLCVSGSIGSFWRILILFIF